MELREIARAVTAVSLAVLAVCAVVMTTTGLAVEHQKTFVRAELEQGVGDQLSARSLRPGTSSLTCPSTVTVKEGVTFTCGLTLNDKKLIVPVTVEDTDSGAYVVGDPHA